MELDPHDEPGTIPSVIQELLLDVVLHSTVTVRPPGFLMLKGFTMTKGKPQGRIPSSKKFALLVLAHIEISPSNLPFAPVLQGAVSTNIPLTLFIPP